MNVIYSTLVLTIWFMSTFFIISVLLIIFDKRKSLHSTVAPPKKLPRISIILPALNEEEGIIPALESLSKVDYPRNLYEVVVINDGSKDRTSEIVRKFISENRDPPIVFIDRKENKGKAYSLNEGIRKAAGELVGCMDGDSILKPDILLKTVGYFSNPKIASVSVRVNVREPKNLLEKMVDVEYAVGLSVSLKVLSLLDSMHVTPGPFSIYRKSVIQELGGFDEKNITEDLEIAFRIQKAGYKLAFCLSTSVSTKVPSTLKSLYKQRNRWYSGSLITLWRHKDLVFNKRMRIFGLFLPLNYSLTVLGLVLFLYSAYLFLSKLFRSINNLSLINFDLMQYKLTLNFDILSVDIFTTMALTMMFMSFLLTKISFSAIHRRVRENFSGFVGFLFFFIFYQLFWFNAFYTVLRRREIKWR